MNISPPMLPMSLAVALYAVDLARATDCNFSGGYALREPLGCPTNTTTCGPGFESRCCPESLYCYTSTTSGAYCCPLENEDCVQDVQDVPRCSDPDWTLWDNGDIESAWCCGPEMFGLTVVNGGVGCTPYGSTLGLGQITATEATDLESLCTTSSPATSSNNLSQITSAGSTTSLPQSSVPLTLAGITSPAAVTTKSSENGVATGVTFAPNNTLSVTTTPSSFSDPSRHTSRLPLALGLGLSGGLGLVILALLIFRCRSKKSTAHQDIKTGGFRCEALLCGFATPTDSRDGNSKAIQLTETSRERVLNPRLASLSLGPSTTSDPTPEAFGSLFDENPNGVDSTAHGKAEQWLDGHKGVLKIINDAWSARPPASPKVRLAIIDTGLQDDAPVLGTFGADKLVYYSVEEEGQEALTKKDSSGHGTRIALLVYKICPHLKLYIIRAAKDIRAAGSQQNVAKAIYWAILQKADIITMSLGFPEPAECIIQAISTAQKSNVLMFAAASNGGATTHVAYPASAEDVFCITSSNGAGKYSDFNPRGSNIKNGYSTLGEAVVLAGFDDPYSGTSYATPIAAAFAALLLDFCGYWFSELQCPNKERLMDLLHRKSGMQKALDIFMTNDQMVHMNRYLSLQEKFKYTVQENKREDKEKRKCKIIAEEIIQKLEQIDGR